MDTASSDNATLRKRSILLAIDLLERERHKYLAGEDSYMLQGARHSYALLAHKKVQECSEAINEMVRLLAEEAKR